jgi:hypothetical protein
LQLLSSVVVVWEESWTKCTKWPWLCSNKTLPTDTGIWNPHNFHVSQNIPFLLQPFKIWKLFFIWVIENHAWARFGLHSVVWPSLDKGKVSTANLILVSS